ncbi:MAG: discoidin domain-containing protein [Myxococcales bacterium]|nr:MAG: discoidin domain-containing protein [Myxococcales bacterium]
MRNESAVSRSVRRLGSGITALGALSVLALVASVPGCGESFVPCEEYRKCEPAPGVGGEAAHGDGDGGDGGSNEGGEPPAGDCEVGALSCQGQAVLQCREGAWTQVGSCPLACVGAGECGGECIPNARDCADMTPRVCTAEGVWQELEACPEACSGEGNCIGQCIPESQDCLDDVPRTCSAEGEWQEAVACPFVCSGAGECTGECKPEDAKCEGNVPYVCHEAGVWIAQPACDKVCSGKGECTGACKPGDKDCSGTKPRTCNEGGAWDEEAACDFVCSGAGECTGECVPGTKVCDGYGYKTCSAEGTYAHGECPTAAPVCGGNAVCGGSCLDSTEPVAYDSALVGECCTISAGTGFLVRRLTNPSNMSCVGVGGGLGVNKAITASSFVSTNPPSNANDGNFASLWKASTAAANEWIMIDFGESVTVNGVLFTFEQSGEYGYKVETSNMAAGIVWSNRGTGTSSDEFAAQAVSWVGSSVRLLRITFTSLPLGKRAALSSVRVY